MLELMLRRQARADGGPGAENEGVLDGRWRSRHPYVASRSFSSIWGAGIWARSLIKNLRFYTSTSRSSVNNPLYTTGLP